MCPHCCPSTDHLTGMQAVVDGVVQQLELGGMQEGGGGAAAEALRPWLEALAERIQRDIVPALLEADEQ